MRKHHCILSIFFLFLVVNEFDTELHQIRAEENNLPKYAIHYIQKEDNLHLIAAYYLNSPRKWEIIFNENRGVITNPNQLVVGKKLVIPVSRSWKRTEPYEKFKIRLKTKLNLDDLATELLSLSRAYDTIQSVPSQINKELERDTLELGGTPEQIDRLKKSVSEKLEPAAIAALITRKLKTSMDETELKELFKWYSSPLGMKITGLARENSANGKWKAVPEISRRVRETREKEISRVEMLNDLDLSGRYTERGIELKRNLFFAAASVSFKNMGSDKNFEDLRAFVDEKKSGFFSEIEDEAIFRLIYTYEKLSDHDLSGYVNFLKTNAAQKFNEIISKTLNESILSSFSPTPQA